MLCCMASFIPSSESNDTSRTFRLGTSFKISPRMRFTRRQGLHPSCVSSNISFVAQPQPRRAFCTFCRISDSGTDMSEGP